MDDVLVLENENLVIKKDGKVLIEDINLTVRSGEKVLITGINGAGKSTLFKAIQGFLGVDGDVYAEFQGGSYRFTGSVTKENLTQKIIYIAQEDFLHKPFSTVERALLEGVQEGIAGRKAYIKTWLETYRPFIQDDMDKKLLRKRVISLSGGERKFVSIIQGLVRCGLPDVRLVLIDEPINNLDAKHIVQLSDLINRIQERNPALAWLIISHCRVFTNVTTAYTVHAQKLVKIEYQPHNCFGLCNEEGYYLC